MTDYDLPDELPDETFIIDHDKIYKRFYQSFFARPVKKSVTVTVSKTNVTIHDGMFITFLAKKEYPYITFKKY